MVPHHSTDSAINCLTAQIGRDAVGLVVYGRSSKIINFFGLLTCLPSPPLAFNCSQPSLTTPVFALVFGWMPSSPYLLPYILEEKIKKNKKIKKRQVHTEATWNCGLFETRTPKKVDGVPRQARVCFFV